MGVSGVMQLTNPSITPSGTTSEGSTDDTYTYNVDFNAIGGDTFTLTGDFEFVGGASELSYSNLPGINFPGTFALNGANGTFTYTVTVAEILFSSALNHSIRIDGNATFGDVDSDTMFFNFTLCFAPGTGIATPEGERAVEALRIGDLVTTADGRAVPVKWIGRTTVRPMFRPADRLAPVRIAAGAFGAGVPNRDLVVTADHGMVLDGMVITAGALVNGSSVQWVDWKVFGESLTYYHVETEAHDVILANGAPAETYVDYVARTSFDNFAEYLALYGAETALAELPMPRISAARLVPEALRARLAARGARAA